MLRQNNAQEILERLEKVYKYSVPSTGVVSTTLAGAALAGDSALELTSEVGFADGDHVFVAGDELELATILDLDAVPDSTLTRKLAFAAALGATVTKVTQDDLGYVEEGGVTLTGSFSQTPIGAANARSAIAYIAAEGGELSASFGLREANLKNVLASFGIAEDSLRGTGTSTDPYLALIGRDTIGTQTNHAYRATLKMINNKNWHADFLNCAPEVAINAALGAKGQPAVWTVQFRPTTILLRSW